MWADHYWLTRQVIVAAVYQIPCLNVDIEALLRNQDDLGRNFSKLTCYKKAGQELATELREHIRIAIAIVIATIASQSIDALYKEWQSNARVIAEIYHKFNCKIKFDKINTLFQEHLEITLAEAIAIIIHDCQAAQIAGDIALARIREMTDYFNSKFC